MGWFMRRSDCVKAPVRVLSALCALVLGLGLQAAHAQLALPAPPAVRAAIGEHGVNFIDLGVVLEAPELSIGDPSSGGMSFTRTWIQGSDIKDSRSNSGWTHNYIGYITWDSGRTNYTVVLGPTVQKFTRAASLGAFTAVEAGPQILTGTGGAESSEILTYTLADGTVLVFDPAYATNLSTVRDARLSTVTTAPGAVTTFTYRDEGSGVPKGPIQSVTNTYGYHLKFEHTSGANGILTKVTAINGAIEYCAPTAATAASCSLSGAWPTVSYSTSTSGANTTETVTNALSQATQYKFTGITYGGSNTHTVLTGIRLPGAGSDNLTYSYSGHRVSSVSDGTGTWTYGLTDNGGGSVTATVTNPASSTQTVNTNQYYLVTSEVDGLSQTTTYTYDSDRRPSTVVSPGGQTITYAYDARSNLTSTSIDPAGGGTDIVTSATYDSTCTYVAKCNKPNSTTDARGNVTDYVYNNTHGGVEKITQPSPDGVAARPETRFGYQANYARYKNSGGTVVQGPASMYILMKIETCVTGAGNACDGYSNEIQTSFDYDNLPNGANNLQPTVIWKSAGNGALMTSITLTYDDVGNVLTVDGPLSGSSDTTRARYDALRRLIGVIGPDPDGGSSLKHRATKTVYRSDGLVDTVDIGTVDSQSDGDWAAFSSLQQTANTYDARGLLTQRAIIASSATQGVTQFSYDSSRRPLCTALRMNASIFGSLPSSACTAGTAGSYGPDRITHNTYDAASQRTQLRTAYTVSGQEQVEIDTDYTASGQVDEVADAKSNQTNNTYDAYGRLYRVIYPDASYEEYGYDAASNRTSIRRRDGTTVYLSYDNLNRQTSDLTGVALTYDNIGRVLTLSKSGHTVTRTWDAHSRLVSEQGAIGTVSYEYDAASRRTKMTWPDSFYVNYDWNVAGDLTAIRENNASSGAGVLATFAYDNLGRRTTLTRGNGVVSTYTFDAAGQLATLALDPASSGYDQTWTYTRNLAGQIVSKAGTNSAYDPAVPSALTRGYATNDLNQIAASSIYYLGFDANGNLATDPAGSYGYDVANRLTSYSGTVSLSYDPVSRLYETAGGSTTRFLYDGVDMIGEYNTSGTLQRRYVHGPNDDEPLVWYEGSGTSDRRWLIADDLGSIVATTNDSGVATSTVGYAEFGEASTITRFGFTGQMYIPEIGLYHYKARAYSPTLGRFLQPDPSGYADGMNIYAYVGNDPVNLIDPKGLQRDKRRLSDGRLCPAGFIAAGDKCILDPEAEDPAVVAARAAQRAARAEARRKQADLNRLADELRRQAEDQLKEIASDWIGEMADDMDADLERRQRALMDVANQARRAIVNPNYLSWDAFQASAEAQTGAFAIGVERAGVRVVEQLANIGLDLLGPGKLTRPARVVGAAASIILQQQQDSNRRQSGASGSY